MDASGGRREQRTARSVRSAGVMPSRREAWPKVRAETGEGLACFCAEVGERFEVDGLGDFPVLQLGLATDLDFLATDVWLVAAIGVDGEPCRARGCGECRGGFDDGVEVLELEAVGAEEILDLAGGRRERGDGGVECGDVAGAILEHLAAECAEVVVVEQAERLGDGRQSVGGIVGREGGGGARHGW